MPAPAVVVLDRFDAKYEPDLEALFAEQWWTAHRTIDQTRSAVGASSVILCAVSVEGDQLVGFARVLTDGVYVALVLDVMVAAAWRGRGIGDLLMEAVTTHSALQAVESVELVCQPGLVAFYARWGFTDQVGPFALDASHRAGIPSRPADAIGRGRDGMSDQRRTLSRTYADSHSPARIKVGILSGMQAQPPWSDQMIAQSLGLIPPQRVLGWAQDGPDESSLVAVVDISGSGYIETWVAAGGGLTMSGLGYGFTGTVAFATARRRDGNSVLKIEVRHGTDVVCEADVAPNSRGFAVWARDLDAHGEWPPHASDVAPISCTMRWLPLDAPRALRKDADVDARLDAARAIATVLRPAVGWVLIELGDSAPEVSALLARARSLPLTSTDGSGVVWEGPTSDPGVWAWALDCLPVASWWHLYEGLSADDELLTYATDSLVGMWVLAPFDHEDLRGWLVRG